MTLEQDYVNQADVYKNGGRKIESCDQRLSGRKIVVDVKISTRQ